MWVTAAQCGSRSNGPRQYPQGRTEQQQQQQQEPGGLSTCGLAQQGPYCCRVGSSGRGLPAAKPVPATGLAAANAAALPYCSNSSNRPGVLQPLVVVKTVVLLGHVASTVAEQMGWVCRSCRGSAARALRLG